MLKVLLIDESEGDWSPLADALVAAGCAVESASGRLTALPELVAQRQPDLLVIDTDSPNRDLVEAICVSTQHTPRPIVLFTQDASKPAMNAALRAGVTSYVVDGVDAQRIRSILDVAIARFQAELELRGQLRDALLALDERKVIERAKGLIMAEHRVDEARAYRLLRQMAMNEGRRMVEIAQEIVASVA